MFNQYPYLNLNDLNLDYILKAIKEMRYEVTNFVSINAIKYADPIQWNITTQYEKNTIVIDPVTGTAYISVAPVPAGVALTRTEYWTVVFDLGSFVTRAAQNFTSRWESDTTTTATFSTPAGAWLVWGDVLYKALVNITAGDTYVVGSNIEHFTVEDLYSEYYSMVTHILTIIGDMAQLTTTDTSDLVHAINSVLADTNATIGDLANLTTVDRDNIVDAINSALNESKLLIGDLNDLTTADKDNLVDAVNSALYESKLLIGNLNDLTTTDKDNIVDALNEVNFNLSNLTDRRYILIGDSYLEGANHHMDDTWTYDIKHWGAFFDEFMHTTSQQIAVGGAGMGGELYTSWLDAFNNATITDPDTVTDVIIGGSANDIGIPTTLANMISGASALSTAIKTRCPNARIWVADIGISVNVNNIAQTQLVHTVYSWFGQFDMRVMTGTTNILATADRLQWDGLHPTQLGNMFIALAMINNILLGSYEEYRAGFATANHGINLLFTSRDGNLYVNKHGNDVITFDTALSGTFSGVGGVSVDMGAVNSDFCVNSSSSYNMGNVAGYAYIGADIYPAVFIFSFLNGHFYMFPLVMQGTGYYTGSISTIVLPPFNLSFTSTVI